MERVGVKSTLFLWYFFGEFFKEVTPLKIPPSDSETAPYVRFPRGDRPKEWKVSLKEWVRGDRLRGESPRLRREGGQRGTRGIATAFF